MYSAFVVPLCWPPFSGGTPPPDCTGRRVFPVRPRPVLRCTRYAGPQPRHMCRPGAVQGPAECLVGDPAVVFSDLQSLRIAARQKTFVGGALRQLAFGAASLQKIALCKKLRAFRRRPTFDPTTWIRESLVSSFANHQANYSPHVSVVCHKYFKELQSRIRGR